MHTSRRNRGQLLHKMKEAEGAEQAFAKQADWHPARAKRPARWWPERGKREEWSVC